MYRYTSTCLEGSISRNRLHGLFNAPAEVETAVSSSSEEIRQDLVESVRRAIARGTYDTPEKWEVALDHLAQQME